MGANLEVEGLKEIQKKILELGKKGNQIENKALKAGAEILKQKISDEAPRSDQPRKPTSGTQSWRTGEHAADNITLGRVKRVGGQKVVDVGISKKDNSNYFYLKFHEFGYRDIPPNPFMGRSVKLSKDKVKATIHEAYKKGLNL